MTAASADPGRAWNSEDPPPSPRRVRKHRLAADLRELLGLVVHLDCEAADDELLAAAESALTTARTAVGVLPPLANGTYGDPVDFSLYERSPISGRSNGLAAPLVVTFEGDRTLAHATYGAAYEGPPTSVHGGYVMAAFDDLLGMAQAASGTAGFTGTLTVKMLGRTPLHERIDYEAGVTRVDGRKIFAWGRSTFGGEVLGEAQGIFIVPRDGLIPEELERFVGKRD